MVKKKQDTTKKVVENKIGGVKVARVFLLAASATNTTELLIKLHVEGGTTRLSVLTSTFLNESQEVIAD